MDVHQFACCFSQILQTVGHRGQALAVGMRLEILVANLDRDSPEMVAVILGIFGDFCCELIQDVQC